MGEDESSGEGRIPTRDKEFKDKKEELDTLIKLKTEELERLQKQLVELKNSISDAEKELSSSVSKTDDLTSKQEQISNLENELKSKNKELEQRESILSEKEQELKDIHSNNKLDPLVKYFLNIFEQISIAVKYKIVDEDVIKDFYYDIFIESYHAFKEYIDLIREEFDSEEIYIQFQELVKSWGNFK